LRRDRTEITAAVLRLALEGASTIRIMEEVRLSYELFTRYRDRLLRSGMIRKLNHRKRGYTFKTTNKGKKYIELVDQLAKLEG